MAFKLFALFGVTLDLHLRLIFATRLFLEKFTLHVNVLVNVHSK